MKPRNRGRRSVAQSSSSRDAERSDAPGTTTSRSTPDPGGGESGIAEVPDQRMVTRSRKRRRLSDEDKAVGEVLQKRSPGAVRVEKAPFHEDKPSARQAPAIYPEGSMSSMQLSPLEAFLQHKLPFLEKNPLHTNSKATRPPKFWDTHLEESQRLNKIVILEDLVEILSENCDEYVRRAIESGRDLSPSFPAFQVPTNDNILDEDTLVAYFQTLSTQFSEVASGLLFGTDWVDVFGFALKAAGPKTSSEAAADAYLVIENPSALISAKDKQDVALIQKYDMHNFVAWEYKNLGFGPQIFRALQTQEGAFQWTACQERVGRHDASSRCPNQNHRTDGRPTITGRPTGPDATSIVDIIKRSTSSKVLEDAEERPSKRPRSDMDATALKKIHDIIQQAWTSAAAQDITFMVLSTGNEDCLGLRHRESQTLFISRPIEPSVEANPSCIKTYVSLYISAFQDAVNRARQLESGTLSSTAQSMLQLRLDRKPDLRNSTMAGLFDRYPAGVYLPRADEDFIRDLEHTPRIDLRLHQHCLATTQYNRNTWILFRHMDHQPSGDPTDAIVLSQSSLACSEGPSDDKIVFLDLDRIFPETSRIWRVYLGIVSGAGSKPEYFSKHLVLKMSRDRNEAANLKIEFENYQRLQAAGVTGVVKCYGFFACQVSSQDTRYFLLLEDGGESLARRRPSTLAAHTKAHRNSYESVLESLHAKNYTHNNITREHVLLNVDLEEARLISLKDCKVVDAIAGPSHRARDIRELGLCLGSSSKVESLEERAPTSLQPVKRRSGKTRAKN